MWAEAMLVLVIVIANLYGALDILGISSFNPHSNPK